MVQLYMQLEIYRFTVSRHGAPTSTVFPNISRILLSMMDGLLQIS